MFNNTWEFFANEKDVIAMVKLISEVISPSTRCYTTFCDWAVEDKKWSIAFNASKHGIKKFYMRLLELGLEDDSYRPIVKQIKNEMEGEAF